MGFIRLSFEGSRTKWFIGVGYAPTESSDEDVKDNFFIEFNSFITKHRKSDDSYTIVMGDFNAEVGCEKNMFNHIFSFGERNSNGDRLRALCDEQKLFNISSFYPKRKNLKWTWKKAESIHSNRYCIKQLDYILSSDRSIFKDFYIYSLTSPPKNATLSIF
uniref:Endo/exonuclease/phosphatase domain-containing protein n=1 Tax=Strongyloides papillosus TaxID=174720 RepID=A0A0N5BLX0_STREA